MEGVDDENNNFKTVTGGFACRSGDHRRECAGAAAPVKLSEEKQAAAEETVREIKESMKADSSSESGNTALENRSKDTAALENKERIACIDGNEEALVPRLRMIERQRNRWSLPPLISGRTRAAAP